MASCGTWERWGGTWSYPAAINNAGQVVGWSYTGEGEGELYHAFLWSDGVMQDLGRWGGNAAVATAINDAGQVAGYSDTASGETHAFLWSDGVMQDLGTLGGINSQATAINDAGQVAGQSITASGETHAFLWSDGVMQDLGTLGGTETTVYDINDVGQVVGWSYTASGEGHAFLYAPSKSIAIDIKPGDATNSINLKRTKAIPVAILSTAEFDARLKVDQTSLTFGATGNENSLVSCAGKAKDVNGDSLRDLICTFSTNETGFLCGTAQGILKGQTVDDIPFEGRDLVTTIPCK